MVVICDRRPFVSHCVALLSQYMSAKGQEQSSETRIFAVQTTLVDRITPTFSPNDHPHINGAWTPNL